MLQVSIHHLTDNDNAIHLAFLYQLRHSAALFLHRSNDFQHGKTFLCCRSGGYRLIHLPVEGFILIQESLRDQDPDIVAFLVLALSCCGWLLVAQFLRNTADLLPDFLADTLLSGQCLGHSHRADTDSFCDIC